MATSLTEQTTIPRLVLAAAETFGDTAAVEDGEVVLTYRELAEAGLDAARAFCAAGLEPGDRVGVWAPNLHEWILAAIGIQAAGGVLVTLNTRLKSGEAAYILRKSRAKMLCTVSDFLGTDYVAAIASEDIPSLEKTIVLRGRASGDGISWAAFLAAGEEVSREAARERALAVGPDDLSDLIFTSGTTGFPKGVMTAHGQNLRTFATWSGVVGLREGDRYLIVNPFFHTFGYKAGWLSAFMRGATVLPHLVFDATSILERIGNDRVSVLPGPPTLYQSLLAHPDIEKYDLSCLRLSATGAAPTPVELIHRMRDELHFDTVVTAYGLTETCGVVSICRPEDDPETIATTSGRAIPGIEVRCVDTGGKDVGPGEAGEVIVRGYNVMQGYFDDEEGTNEAFDADGFLHTGDIAVMDERGYLRITDRIKDMFIMGGFNCYPAEIENILFSSGEFAQVAVIGVPDERMGEVAMAFVVPAPGVEVTWDSVIQWSRDNMANYKVPRRVEVVDALPTNATGKVLKYLLRERAAAGP